MVRVFEASAVAVLMARLPELSVTPPVNVFVPWRVTMPRPVSANVSPPVPTMAPDPAPMPPSVAVPSPLPLIVVIWSSMIPTLLDVPLRTCPIETPFPGPAIVIVGFDPANSM